MTAVEDTVERTGPIELVPVAPPTSGTAEPTQSVEPIDNETDDAASDGPLPLTARRATGLVVAWLLVLVVATLIVAYPLGPILQHRAQHRLLRSFRTDLQYAAHADQGLAGLVDAKAPAAPHPGTAVAIVDLGPLRVRQVVVEGTSAAQTASGPGHVAGTAGLGQPGNAVVVGRRTGWGGPFAHLDRLRAGDEVIASTTQGQTVYRVRSVRAGKASARDLAPSKDDRLTLTTSASASPFATARSLVVVARLVGPPFEPTAQNGRDPGADGRSGDPGVVAQLGLLALVFAAVAAAGVVAQRKWKPLVAYLLTTPALVVLALLVAQSASRLLPAWS